MEFSEPCVSYWTLPIQQRLGVDRFTSIIVARFLLNLQDLDNSFDATSRRWSLTRPEVPVFANRLVGPMGSSLSSGLFDDDESQDDDNRAGDGELEGGRC